MAAGVAGRSVEHKRRFMGPNRFYASQDDRQIGVPDEYASERAFLSACVSTLSSGRT